MRKGDKFESPLCSFDGKDLTAAGVLFGQVDGRSVLLQRPPPGRVGTYLLRSRWTLIHAYGLPPFKHRGGARTEWRLGDGRLHRLDGPAIVGKGLHAWFRDGKPFRTEGKPQRDYRDGTGEWLDENGDVFRIAGPEMESWFQGGEFHREDGPAVQYIDGQQEWWWHGKEFAPPDGLEASLTLQWWTLKTALL